MTEEEQREAHKQEAKRRGGEAKLHFETAIALLQKSIKDAGPNGGVALNSAEAAVTAIMQGLRANTFCECNLAKLS